MMKNLEQDPERTSHMSAELPPCVTRVCKPTEQTIHEAAELLRAGQLVAFPTETVYGLGADALNADAVPRIYVAKGRPSDNPLIVHVATAEAAEPLCDVSPLARKLMDAFWPGPLTISMPKKSCIPPVVNANLPSVAIRCPSHPVAHALLLACGVPVAAPSANTSGRPSPTTAQHVLDDLNGRVPLIIDGGPCSVGVESTVLDLTSEVPTVLRPGGVTPEQIARVTGEVRVADSVMRPLREGEKALSPGMRYRHYAPKGQLTLVTGAPENVRALCRRKYLAATAEGRKARVLAFEEHLPYYAGCDAECIGRLSEPETVARALFAALRQLDDERVDTVLCEAMEATGVGLAVMNRLNRAAAFHVLNADAEEKP